MQVVYVVKYCNAYCQKNHWATHKTACKLRAAELHDEALFKDPPQKEECPICFLPMPHALLAVISLPLATISSIPIYDYSEAKKELASMGTEIYYSCCCGKSVCQGCIYSFCSAGNHDKCPFCKAERMSKTDEEEIEELMKRVEVNDAGAIYVLGSYYTHGQLGLLQDLEKAIELYARAAELGNRKAHKNLGDIYHRGGSLKKAKFHYEAAAMGGDEVARCNLGTMENKSGNMEQAIKHFTIAASAGCFTAMHALRTFFERGLVSRESIDSTLKAYNNSCVEMRSEARDSYISVMMRVYESTNNT